MFLSLLFIPALEVSRSSKCRHLNYFTPRDINVVVILMIAIEAYHSIATYCCLLAI